MKPPIKQFFMSHTQMQTKYGLTMFCDQNCGLRSINRHRDTQKHRHTDRKVKTEGEVPKILSNDTIYIKTVVIGGPKDMIINKKSIM